MKRNFEKSIHVLNQIIGYCKGKGAREIDTRITFGDGQTLITVSSSIEGLGEKEIKDLRKQIGIPRQPEIEQNYWNIGLSGNLGGEMALVGMMTDRCEACYENGVLSIKAERKD